MTPGLSGIGWKRCGFFGVKVMPFGGHHHEVLHGPERLGREARLSVVRQVVGNLELRLAGLERKAERVMVLRARFGGLIVDRLPARAARESGLDGRALGNHEFKGAVVNLRARRLRLVLDGEQRNHLELVAVGLDAVNLDHLLQAVNFFRRVVNREFGGRVAGH